MNEETKQNVEWRRYGNPYGFGGWELYVNCEYRGVVSVTGHASGEGGTWHFGCQPLAAQALLRAAGVGL